jgi:hypothetical protein
MRRHRKSHKTELGDALSFEEVLTIITVLLLLRVVFMVPMVNLDKAKTVKSQSDSYWSRQAGYVLSRPPVESDLRPYRAAFGMRDGQGFVTRQGDLAYVEVSTPDSNLLVVQHDQGRQKFIALRVQGLGHARSFQRGRLLWSRAEGEWFISSDTLDYGSHASSLELEQEFRDWTRKSRGY